MNIINSKVFFAFVFSWRKTNVFKFVITEIENTNEIREHSFAKKVTF